MILMIDNYDSFTYNLVQYLGELGSDIKVFRNDTVSVTELIELSPSGIVIGPGPCSPTQAGICVDLIKAVSSTNIPLLGVCLGHQAIGQAFGGKIVQHKEISHGKIGEIHHNSTGIFREIRSPFKATRYHSLVISNNNFPNSVLNVTASLADGTIMGIQHKEKSIFGVQFHPESIASEHGYTILQQFIYIIKGKKNNE